MGCRLLQVLEVEGAVAVSNHMVSQFMAGQTFEQQPNLALFYRSEDEEQEVSKYAVERS